MTPREIVLVASVTLLLMLLMTVRLERGERLPAPSAVSLFPALPPTSEKCYAVGFPGQPPRKIVDAKPVYPEAARAAGITGTVIVAATIDEDGRVIRAEVLRHVETLDAAAIEAVRQWRFAPARLRGEAVCVTMSVAVAFP